jgi:hypothetical protein
VGESGSFSPPSAQLDPWETVDRWSEATCEYFFSGRWAGRPVYLDLEEEVTKHIAARAGVGDSDPRKALADAIKPTLNLNAGTPPLLQGHVRRTDVWRRGGANGPPPFLAVLAFMSLVAEGMRSDGEFRASNYYGRFCQALELEPTSRLRTKISNGFGDHSLALWGALNDWLDAYGGARGLPTAFAFDSRTYVGLPLSQALIRDADRRVLPEMFAAYRLRPGQVISRSDMARLLGDWIAASRLSSSLKRLLERQDEVANRIADVACVELQAWGGALPQDAEATAPGEASLLLVAQLRTQPLRRLYFDLGVERPGLPEGPYALGEGASSHAIAALSVLGGALSLEEEGSEGWRSIRGGSEVSLGDLLLANVTLSGPEETLHRAARRLIVLEHDDELRRFTEVTRIQLGTTNLLLCHESLAGQVEEILGEIARPRPLRLVPSELQGLPEGWVAFSGVEVFAISDTEEVDLIPLVPLSWTQASLGGGFSLPGRLTWLGVAPPEVRVSSAEGETLIVTMHCERALGAEMPQALELARFAGHGVVPVPASADGDFRIILSDAEHSRAAPLASALLRLRSADTPRPILAEDEPALRHHLSDCLGALSASSSGPLPELDGALISGAERLQSPAAAPLPPVSLAVSGAIATEEDDLPAPSTKIRGGPTPGCLLGRGHHFLLPYYGPDSPQVARVEGTCRECGLEKDWPTRPRRRRRNANSSVNGAEETTRRPLRDLRPIVEGTSANWDLLVGAISYARRGSWTTFEAMAVAVKDSPWFALEAARLLSSLGHLNVELHPRSLRPQAWSLAPPTIASVEDKRAVLCGYRSPSLLEAIAADIEILNGRLVLESAEEGPTIASIEGLGFEELEELALASESLPHPLQLSNRPSETIAAQLPQLVDLREELPQLERPLARPLERFDFASASWARVEAIEAPGAYRFLDQPLRYCVAAGEAGSLTITDNRLAKWLGAQQLGLSLLSYDPQMGVLACPLGAQLPGLYERAAVLASGHPPTRRRNGTVTYEGISPELAGQLWSKLSSEGLR